MPPWSDNSDDDGKPGPHHGPWGAPPPSGGQGGDGGAERKRQAGRGRRPTPPPMPEDLSALWRRLRSRLEEIFGGAGRPGGPVNPQLIGVIGAGALLLWLALGIYFVQPAEQGVVTTFGAYTRSTDPGAHWRFIPFEEVRKVPVASLKRVDIGGAPGSEVPQESLMLTGDENIVDLAFTVQYRINDATKYLFKVTDPDETVKAVAESSVREVIGKTPLQDILTNGRGKVQDQTASLMQRILDNYGAGITVVEVQIRSANPPKEVIPDFQAVASAGQYADSAVNEGNAYRNRVVNEAKGDAAKIVQAAQGYRERVVRTAEGDAARFNQIYEQYKRAPAVTRERLYLEAMERVLAKSSKVIVDTHGATAPIILPSDAFRPKAPAPDTQTASPGASQ